ncbi:hypothetical protein BaRGS_00010362 [Batillaria attramentaria]|uniref:Uncharacterized protein n=1 Tax=Batillaria attramentaria TaxID=370345 RepID=A0ABD0LH05_9CAEN
MNYLVAPEVLGSRNITRVLRITLLCPSLSPLTQRYTHSLLQGPHPNENPHLYRRLGIRASAPFKSMESSPLFRLANDPKYEGHTHVPSKNPQQQQKQNKESSRM